MPGTVEGSCACGQIQVTIPTPTEVGFCRTSFTEAPYWDQYGSLGSEHRYIEAG